MDIRRREWKIAAFGILVGLAFVTNPELRALLFVVDALGLELIFFLLAIQLRGFLPFIRSALASVCFFMVSLVSSIR
jgi:hypothetical protein